jgi:hypothetical protein
LKTPLRLTVACNRFVCGVAVVCPSRQHDLRCSRRSR